MTDRMKESVFSSLGEVSGMKVYDLYAGSGSLGLEALSRGAKAALFVENARDAIVKINENIAATDLEDRAEVLWAEVRPTLQRMADQRVDLIFIDPPYTMPLTSVVDDLEAIVMQGYLADEGRIVLHRPAKERTPQPFGLELVWEREFGQSAVMVFIHQEEDE
jgi:16S rRNA (guanine966-N2)-methyltransferase